MISEEWRSIPGWPAYEASNMGAVRKGDSVLAQRQMKSGYLYVTLIDGKRRKDFRVNRLIGLAFLGLCPDGYHVCHNNGLRTDNRLSNLRHDTVKGNHADKKKHGTQCRGSTHGRAKIIEEDVVEIRKKYTLGMNYSEISRIYGLSPRMIMLIVTRQNWSHVP